jgi:hypothetical protein
MHFTFTYHHTILNHLKHEVKCLRICSINDVRHSIFVSSLNDLYERRFHRTTSSFIVSVNENALHDNVKYLRVLCSSRRIHMLFNRQYQTNCSRILSVFIMCKSRQSILNPMMLTMQYYIIVKSSHCDVIDVSRFSPIVQSNNRYQPDNYQ